MDREEGAEYQERELARQARGQPPQLRSTNKRKKAALTVIADNLNEDQFKGPCDIFMKLVANGNGKLTIAEQTSRSPAPR
jgi:hypothetical protein